MTSRKCTEEELYEFASLLFLKEKDWSDLEFLDDEDKAKILTILQQGEGLLKKNKKDSLTAMGRKVKTGKIIKGKVKKDLVFREGLRHKFRAIDQPCVDITELSRCVKFTVFPFSLIIKESELLQRKFMEALNRSFSSSELALLLAILSESQVNGILSCVSPRLAKEVRSFMENPGREWREDEVNAVFAKYSVAAVKSLSSLEEASLDLKAYVKKYEEELDIHLQKYCGQLPEKFGILEALRGFRRDQWMKLAGLTPRADMVLLSQVIPKDFMEKLFLCLPARQKEDILELISFQKKEKKGKVSIYVEILDTVKHWLTTISKVSELEEDHEN